jgi:hypothetical protein
MEPHRAPLAASRQRQLGRTRLGGGRHAAAA